MIYLSIAISNPWSDTWKTIRSKVIKVSENKTVELNVYRTHHILSVDFIINTRDHAGVQFSVGVLGYNVEVHLYDVRHDSSE